VYYKEFRETLIIYCFSLFGAELYWEVKEWIVVGDGHIRWMGS
jgi:hypothetical protein